MQRIFVGDVQGCADELDEVIERAERVFGRRFELWLVGDAINRGPANLRVLRCVRERVEAGRAQLVLGNHEIAFLECAFGLRALRAADTFGDLLDAPDVDDWVDWLRSRPLVVRGRMNRQPFAMVHAATHPGWSLRELARQASRVQGALSGPRGAARAFLAGRRGRRKRDVLARLTNCRSVDGDAWSANVPQGRYVPWHAAWSQEKHGYGVVYGHWSLQGLHVAHGLRGLDTGCVHHGRSGRRWLTAWVPDARRHRPFDVPYRARDFWKVPARRAYFEDAR
ncbi:MAG: metallophosphoesterase [Myxococcota bacterium]